MTIYLDVIFIINLVFDFLLLLVVNIILKRNITLGRILIGSLFGSSTIFLLFIDINSSELFIFKILISIIMIIITFKYKSFRYTIKNLLYLYFTSVLLGGFLYYLNLEFSLDNQGIIFFYKGLSVNVVFLIISAPIILYFYVKQNKYNKVIVNNYYQVKITMIDNRILTMNGYYDTGNTLKDPYFKKPIVIVNKNKMFNQYQYIYVPYKTIGNSGLMKCIKINSLFFNNNNYSNVLIGISENRISIDGIDCIINGLLER